jgi:hypothetical protein
MTPSNQIYFYSKITEAYYFNSWWELLHILLEIYKLSKKKKFKKTFIAITAFILLY